MDKRTLLFVLSLTFTLFFVNMYFESQHTESLRDWRTQQAAKREQQVASLNQEIQKRTAQASQLPLVPVSQEPAGRKVWTTAVQAGKALIVLEPESGEVPEKIYAKGDVRPYALSASATNGVAVHLYRLQETDLATVGDLPDFGRFELQLVSTGTQEDPAAVSVYVADYVDAHVEILQQVLSKLQQQEEPPVKERVPFVMHSAIALMKTDQGYVAAGVYDPQTGVIEQLNVLPKLAPFLETAQKKTAIRSDAKGQEKFYVLETPYQQVVFSNYGGAIVEINLPFQGKSDKLSAVKEIDVDRDMVEKHPYNARFPAHAYLTPAKAPNGEGEEHAEGVLGGYYPLLRRDLIEKDKRKNVRVAPRYYAFNIVSDYPETAELIYKVKQFDQQSIVFEAVQSHRTITKTYSVAAETQAPYCIDLTVKIEGDTRNLWLTSGIPEVEWISGAPAPALKYRLTRNQQAEVLPIDLPKDSLTVTSVYPDWICNSNGFFGVIMDSIEETEPGYRVQYVPGVVVPSRLVEIGQEYDRYSAKDMPGYLMLLPIPSKGGQLHYRIFAGPFAESVLKKVDEVYSNPATGYNPDYIACQTFHGWFAFISEPFAKFLFVLMKFFYSLTGSWAFSIVLLTVALRVMLWPLNSWSTKSMLKMQQIAPKVAAVQEKYKKDPKQAQLEVMNLYRDGGVNPISGCLPLLIQMPFLIGMFDLLKSTFELRGASFIPGWIDNLAAPDVLFRWDYPIFFIGNEFHLLPFLLGGVMYLQQAMMSSLPKNSALWTDQQRQQKMMGNMMTVVFTVMFYNFPSGLNIYWLSSMLLGMLQQYITTKQMKQGKK